MFFNRFFSAIYGTPLKTCNIRFALFSQKMPDSSGFNIYFLIEKINTYFKRGAAIPPQWLKPCGILAV
jgi:hypothetical protein